MLPLSGATPEMEALVRRLLRRGGSRELAQVRAKSLALTSGKGGVGKTITATNLAIYYARKGLRTGLIDLDPLSDVAALLDLADSEAVLAEGRLDLSGRGLTDYLLPVFRNLDLLLPAPKLNTYDRTALVRKLFQELPGELASRYDLLIFDLPAGSEYEDNLAFLPFMGLVLLITNPEPTAHAAAGSYIRQAMTAWDGLSFHLWHNRFAPDSGMGFNGKDVVGNYNRNVVEEMRIPEEQRRRIVDLASVPEDPALNMLRGSPAAELSILRFLIDTLQFIHEGRVAHLAGQKGLAHRAFELVKGFMARHKRVDDAERYLQELGEYLGHLLDERTGPAVPIFTPEERGRYLAFLAALQSDAVAAGTTRTLELLEEKLHGAERSARLAGRPAAPGAAPAGSGTDRALDRELGSLLMELHGSSAREELLRAQGGLLLFYFSLYKLLRSPSVLKLIGELVPLRPGPKGGAVRDRRRQIRDLVEGDSDYKRRYLRLLRTLHPVVGRQISTVVRVFGLPGLVFRTGQGHVARGAYVKLLANFLHDTLYGGLSVVVGFRYRSAARAFQAGAEAALQLLRR
jgi:MinD-like ATPase involved in chromosome partitioning or flagellar assembly